MSFASEREMPLADVRVLAIEQFGAGPWATLQFADLGAEVVKIEDPTVGGDVGRYVPPFQQGEDSLFFESVNRNKRSVSLDLRGSAGRRAFHRLVGQADAVFSNLRGDGPEKLGITFDSLRRHNERIVCCSLSGFGMTGPRAAQGGYDYMIQGLAGWMTLTGEPDAPPTKTGLSLVDLSGGYVAAVAMLAGLWRARRDGVGCDCDISLFDTALAELFYVGTWAATEGYVPERQPESAHPSIVPFQNFRTADNWIVVSAPKPSFWQRLCMAIERPELAKDPAYATFAGRDQNRDALLPILRAAFARRSTAEWLDVLQEAGVPCAPVNDVEDALADPQTKARESVIGVPHPTLGNVKHIASPLRLSSTRRLINRAPRRGEHTLQVLAEMGGFSKDELDALADEGAFGDMPVGGASPSHAGACGGSTIV
jgi:crotonobetainyl-CoA:carnitine CoA-transferase CaiB-like acyl-CoA transferase